MPKSDSLPRVHVFRVVPTGTHPDQVKITSEYTGKSVVVPYSAGSAHDLPQLAADYLTERGFRLSHICSAPRGCFLMASNFDKPL